MDNGSILIVPPAVQDLDQLGHVELDACTAARRSPLATRLAESEIANVFTCIVLYMNDNAVVLEFETFEVHRNLHVRHDAVADVGVGGGVPLRASACLGGTGNATTLWNSMISGSGSALSLWFGSNLGLPSGQSFSGAGGVGSPSISASMIASDSPGGIATSRTTDPSMIRRSYGLTSCSFDLRSRAKPRAIQHNLCSAKTYRRFERRIIEHSGHDSDCLETHLGHTGHGSLPSLSGGTSVVEADVATFDRLVAARVA